MQTIQDYLSATTKQLNNFTDTAQLDAELLLCFILNKPRSYLYTWPDKNLSKEESKKFNTLIARRVKGEPVAHILGERGFWSLNLAVTPDTLIPRPDTERLVELAIERIPNEANWDILDLGTGTGAIALSIAKEKPNSFVIATDQSKQALNVAKKNALNNQVKNINFIQSNWFSDLENKQFNMIISNPPYIKENDPHLQQGDVRFEPLSALTSGKDGLDDIRIIINDTKKYLDNDGVLLLEHGYDQAVEVAELLQQAGYRNIENFTDLGNNPRVSIGYD